MGKHFPLYITTPDYIIRFAADVVVVVILYRGNVGHSFESLS